MNAFIQRALPCWVVVPGNAEEIYRYNSAGQPKVFRRWTMVEAAAVRLAMHKTARSHGEFSKPCTRARALYNVESALRHAVMTKDPPRQLEARGEVWASRSDLEHGRHLRTTALMLS